MTSFKPDFSTCHTVTLTEKCQEICMQSSTTTVKHISSNNFCKLSDILSTMLILSVFGLCLNPDLYLWWMIINICSIIVIYVFQTFSDDRKSSIQINSNINTTNNNTNNNTNKTSNNKPAIEPMLKMFNALNINNDEHKYNYKALHPAYKLINEYGWDIFHTNLVNTVIDQKGLSIRNDRDFPQTNYQLFHYYVSYFELWTEYSILCRGLIIDPLTKKIIACSFPKFFNFAEYDPELRSQITEDFTANIKNISVLEKMDGVLGICFYCSYTKMWRIATRGAFQSKQAKWANEYLNKHCNNHNKIFTHGHTYMFEIIADEHKILIDYDFEGFVLLAAYNDCGYEYQYRYLNEIGDELNGMRIVKQTQFSDIHALLNECKCTPVTVEGWVAHFPNGLRIKFKGFSYLSLARLSKNITRKFVEKWILHENESIEVLLNSVPEEFHVLVSDWYRHFYALMYKLTKELAIDLLLTFRLDNKQLNLLRDDFTAFGNGNRYHRYQFVSEFHSCLNQGRNLCRDYLDSIRRRNESNQRLRRRVKDVIAILLQSKHWRCTVMSRYRNANKIDDRKR